MVVNTTPSPILSATIPGISSTYEPSGEIIRASATAPTAPMARPAPVCL
jgi:hypothetical protein